MTNKKDQEWLDEKITQASDFGEVRFDAQQWKQKYILNESRESSLSCKDFKSQKNRSPSSRHTGAGYRIRTAKRSNAPTVAEKRHRKSFYTTSTTRTHPVSKY